MSELRKYMIAVGSLSVPPNAPGRLLYSSLPVGNADALTAVTLMFLLGAFHGQMLVANVFPVAKSDGRAVTMVCVNAPSINAAPPSFKVLTMSGDMNFVLVVTVVSA